MSFAQCSPRVVVLAGGVSGEREVSLGSGRATALAAARSYPTRFVDVREAALPPGIDPKRDLVLSTLHGTFGEDGGMQRLLDAAGIAYAGCDAESSELTFDKLRTKEVVAAEDVPVIPGMVFTHESQPTPEVLMECLGEDVVIKPNRGGSSVGLAICEGAEAVRRAMAELGKGEWIAETKIKGREITVGILHGKALPVVEIAPKSGVFDYQSKYTKGLTEYLAPAPLAEEIASEAQQLAEIAFATCGCRDYARIDFMITSENELFMLEINTLPGMKETSLLPMGASCVGLDFTALVGELIKPAIGRFNSRGKEAVGQ